MLAIAHAVFVLNKLLELKFLQWSPYPMNPANVNNANNNPGQRNNLSLLEAIIKKNYCLSLLAIIMMDRAIVFHTTFEYLVFIFIYLAHSYIRAGELVISNFNKKVSLTIRIDKYLDNWDSGVIFIIRTSEEKRNILIKNKERLTLLSVPACQFNRYHSICDVVVLLRWLYTSHSSLLSCKSITFVITYRVSWTQSDWSNHYTISACN